MKKAFHILTFIVLLLSVEALGQKVTFLDSFEVYNKTIDKMNRDTFINLFEDKSGQLVGFGVNRSAGYFYEFTYSNGQFEKTDSSLFHGKDHMNFRVGEEYKGVRSVNHHIAWSELSSAGSTMALRGVSQKYKTLGSWKKGNGFANYTRYLKEPKLLVHQYDRGFVYKGLYHFHGAVIGQGHTGEPGLYSYNGNTIKRIHLDLQGEFTYPTSGSNFQIENDVIYLKGTKRRFMNRNVYSCDYHTGKLIKSDSSFSSVGLQFRGNENQFDIREIEGGGYFRLVKIKSSNTYMIQVTGLGTIEPPINISHVTDGAWHQNAFYLAHFDREEGKPGWQGYISRYDNGKWSTSTFEFDGGIRSMRFVKGKERLVLAYSPLRPIGSPSQLHVYSVDDNLSSVAETSRNQFSIYPNPSTGIINVQTRSNTMINQIEVYNLLGHAVKTVDPNSNKVQVDITKLPAGMYFFKINGQESIRVIKTAQ